MYVFNFILYFQRVYLPKYIMWWYTRHVVWVHVGRWFYLRTKIMVAAEKQNETLFPSP